MNVTDDWAAVPLFHLVAPRRNQVQPSSLEPDEPYVGLEHVESATGLYRPATVGSAEVRSAKFRYETGDVLYGKLRPGLRKCVVALERGVCSTDLLPLQPLVPEVGPVIAAQLRSEWFARRIAAVI